MPPAPLRGARLAPDCPAPSARVGRSLTMQPCLPSLAARRPALRNCCLYFAIPEAVNLTFYGLFMALGAGTPHPAAPVAALYVIRGIQAVLMHGTLATYAYRRRREVRRLEGIPGAAWKDWCLYFNFPACAVSSGCTSAAAVCRGS